MLETQRGHQGAAHGKKSWTPTAAHRQTSLLLRVLVRTSVALTLPETRASGRSANSPSSEPHEEKLELGSPEHTRAGTGVSHRAARGAALGHSVLARGRRRQSHLGDSGEGGWPPEGVVAAPGATRQLRAFPFRPKGHPRAYTHSCHLCMLAGEGTQAPWSRPEGCLGVGCVPRLFCRAAEESSRNNALKLSFAAALRNVPS